MRPPPPSAPIEAVLCDLLMAVMDSIATWAAAAGSRTRGLAWRDAVTARMREATAYQPYEDLVRAAASDLGIDPKATAELLRRWGSMRPWPDSGRLADLGVPYGFVTNCSRSLAEIAAGRSGLAPRLVLSAEEAGWYKPERKMYLAACRRMGVAPARTAFIAGAAYDAAGARDSGLQAWLVSRRPIARPPVGVAIADSVGEVVAALSERAIRR